MDRRRNGSSARKKYRSQKYRSLKKHVYIGPLYCILAFSEIFTTILPYKWESPVELLIKLSLCALSRSFFQSNNTLQKDWEKVWGNITIHGKQWEASNSYCCALLWLPICFRQVWPLKSSHWQWSTQSFMLRESPNMFQPVISLHVPASSLENCIVRCMMAWTYFRLQLDTMKPKETICIQQVQDRWSSTIIWVLITGLRSHKHDRASSS